MIGETMTLEEQIRAKALLRLEELHNNAHQATQAYDVYLKEIQAECPHETILYHESDIFWSNGYSRSSARTYYCPACKMTTYTGWETTPLTRANHQTKVTDEEMKKARGWRVWFFRLPQNSWRLDHFLRACTSISQAFSLLGWQFDHRLKGSR